MKSFCAIHGLMSCRLVKPLAICGKAIRAGHFGNGFLANIQRDICGYFSPHGRSDGVMVGLRGKLAKLLAPWFHIETEAGPTVAAGNATGTQNEQTEKTHRVARARLLRRISSCARVRRKAALRWTEETCPTPNVETCQEHGAVIVIVLPISPIYGREFLTPKAVAQFEASLSEAQAPFRQRDGSGSINCPR